MQMTGLVAVQKDTNKTIIHAITNQTTAFAIGIENMNYLIIITIKMSITRIVTIASNSRKQTCCHLATRLWSQLITVHYTHATQHETKMLYVFAECKH